MPIPLGELVDFLRKDPALLLGAGASIPSGAPTGAALAHTLWKKVANSEPISDDLLETTSILCRRHGRSAVVEEIKNILRPLRPTGGLLGLPNVEWGAIFTTDFDQLVEAAYRRHNKQLTVFRSNYDFTRKEDASGHRLYKIHGCISQDRSNGDKSSLLLTEDDYDDHKAFRQASFVELERTLLQSDVLIIGQSLRDRHLQDLVKEVLKSKAQGTEGQVYLLAYDRDDLRAQMLEDRGAKVAFGGIDELMHAFAQGSSVIPASTQVDDNNETLLPLGLVSTVRDVSIEVEQPANVVRMFNGGPATYSDITANLTFERDHERSVLEAFASVEIAVAILTGAAGVGKTTLARKIASGFRKLGYTAWEHKNEFVFRHKAWLETEAQLRSSGARGLLVLDECTHFMKEVNNLLDALSTIDKPALQILATANSAQWTPRIKTRNFFARGQHIVLSSLSENEMRSLLNLLENSKPISDLVQTEFKRETRNKQFERLRQKCSADMFVCLKNIFANENLDTILLQEYDLLAEPLQEYYRFVAALEAVGTRVHRQLILRMLGISASEVAAVLNGLSGIVDEFDIKPSRGIYGWSTRHLVIAQKITEYKFSHVDELTRLFDQIIDNINPLEPLELQSIRAICDTEFGIARIGDGATRERLYRRLVSIVPAERIPWHRLIRERLDQNDIVETEYLIRDAAEAAGADSPIDRYRVRLLVLRSSETPGISLGDRLALLRKAFELATTNIDRHKLDKYSYRELCHVAIELNKRGENAAYMDEAIARMREGCALIMDPDLDRMLQRFEAVRAKMH
ncbi:SIR2 family protein [Bradyrhizobium jicamae]|uniref:SIR2 family protein n=1 Tax=Bradyrhizobium jicamae TaxID=280332 RepID=UPI001BAD5B20|nr:SIR2 family protein [Bradyrhizobium jicamae]MBR0757206.1 SIR2 family protein [Bradyrhizobium jicamae]